MEEHYKPPQAELGERPADIPAPFPTASTPYKVSGIGLATFLGSSLAGGVLLYLNEKQRGNPQRGYTLLGIALLILALIIGLAILLPVEVPSVVFGAVQMFAMVHISHSNQGQQLTYHQSQGHGMASNWKAAGISLLVVLGILAAAVPVVLLLDNLGILNLAASG